MPLTRAGDGKILPWARCRWCLSPSPKVLRTKGVDPTSVHWGELMCSLGVLAELWVMGKAWVALKQPLAQGWLCRWSPCPSPALPVYSSPFLRPVQSGHHSTRLVTRSLFQHGSQQGRLGMALGKGRSCSQEGSTAVIWLGGWRCVTAGDPYLQWDLGQPSFLRPRGHS